MKSLRGLRWALESTRPRYAPFQPTPIARASFLTWRRSKVKAPGVASTPRSHHDEANGGPVTPPKPPQHVLSQPMRAVMRQLPHPVVVITTLENTRSIAKVEDMLDKRFPRPIPRAMTVSSFTSLSVDPVPRVTFNITLPSTTYQALAKCGRFNAHILTGDEHGARIADLFTRGNRPTAAKPAPETESPESPEEPDLGVLAGLEELNVHVLGQEDWHKEWELARDYGGKVLDTIKAGGYKTDVEIPPSGTLPLLQGKGILHVLKCQYRHLTPLVDGDFDHHAIVMGEVLDIIPGESVDQSDLALAYADRAYRQMGEKLLERPVAEPPAPEEENTPLSDDVSTDNTEEQK